MRKDGNKKPPLRIIFIYLQIYPITGAVKVLDASSLSRA